MKILWLCNKTPKPIIDASGLKLNSMGGWLDDMCERFIGLDHVQFTIMSPDKIEKRIINKKFKYFSFIENDCINLFRCVLKDSKPDIIHIWGTEFKHSNTFIKVCEQLGLLDRCIVSIQGLVSIYGKYHYTEGLPSHVVNRFTLRDFIRQDNIKLARKKFLARGTDELEVIKKVKHVIGRTDWDRATSKMINPSIQYHFCNESLRGVFYSHRWDINFMQRHRIFFSQCSSPVKGFHYMLEALYIIKAKYPDVTLYTTGKNLLNLSLKDKLLITSYQKYLLELIERYDLKNNVKFLGYLNEDEMCEQYLKANVFASASTIENSPNSVGEAMLVGCPVVAADVGGIKNMLIHEQEGLVYQSSAPYMLAYYVNKVFENDDLALLLSNKSIIKANITHDRNSNFNKLVYIYASVIGEGKIQPS